MIRPFIFAFAAASATLWGAASIQSNVLGPAGATPAVAHDGDGNLIYVSRNSFCSTLDANCGAYSVVKTDASGKVLFRRALGGRPSPFLIFPGSTGVGVDARGNVVVAVSTDDGALATVQPIQTAMRGDSDIFLWKISADGERILLATYLGGTERDIFFNLAVDNAGDAIFSVLASAGFPGASGPPPTGESVQPLLVKVNLATPRVEWAVTTPSIGSTLPIHVTRDNTAQMLSVVQGDPPRSVIFQVTSEGRASIRPTGLPLTAIPTHFTPASDGGYWFSGPATSLTLPVTENALQRFPGTRSYYRVEDRQAVSPDSTRGVVVRQLAVDPTDLRRQFASTNAGLMRSDDNGWTWTLVQDSIEFRFAINLVTGGGRVWLSIPGINGPPVLLVSDDNGESFQRISLPPLSLISPMVAHPKDPNVLYGSSNTDLLSTRNGGQSWTVTPMNATVVHIAVDPEDPLHVFVQTNPFNPSAESVPALWQSKDGGATFDKSLTVNAESGFFDPFEAGTYFFKSSGLLRRTTRETFPESTIIPGDPMQQVVPHPGTPGVFFGIRGFGSAVYRSTDRGATWEPWSEILPFVPGPMVIGDGGVVHIYTFAVSADSYIAKSDANGAITYLSYLGGASNEQVVRIFTNSDGQLVVTGNTDSADFPRTEEPLRGEAGTNIPFTPFPAFDMFVTTLNADGSLASSLLIGGPAADTLIYAAPGKENSVTLFGVANPGFPGLARDIFQIFPSFVAAQLKP